MNKIIINDFPSACTINNHLDVQGVLEKYATYIYYTGLNKWYSPNSLKAPSYKMDVIKRKYLPLPWRNTISLL